MYVLKSTSLTSRFYSWLWDTDVMKFRNMCPYFWKYVFTILFLPLILPAKVLFIILEKIVPKSSKRDEVYEAIATSKPVNHVSKFFKWIASFDVLWYTVGKIFKWLMSILMILGGIVIFGGLSYLVYLDPIRALIFLGSLTVSFTILGILIYLSTAKNLGKVLWSPFKLCGNMIYNLYKNMCPMITWDN